MNTFSKDNTRIRQILTICLEVTINPEDKMNIQNLYDQWADNKLPILTAASGMLEIAYVQITNREVKQS